MTRWQTRHSQNHVPIACRMPRGWRRKGLSTLIRCVGTTFAATHNMSFYMSFSSW